MYAVKKSAIIFTCVCFLLSLCACTVQKRTDALNFCERLNSMQNAELIDKDSFYCAEKCFDYYFFVGRVPALLSLTEDTQNTVRKAELTVSKGADLISEGERQKIHSLITDICAVITGYEKQKIADVFSENEITADKTDFETYCISFDIQSAKCFILCNSDMIFFSVSIPEARLTTTAAQ